MIGESYTRKTSSGHISFVKVVVVLLVLVLVLGLAADATVAGFCTALEATSWSVEQNPGLGVQLP